MQHKNFECSRTDTGVVSKVVSTVSGHRRMVASMFNTIEPPILKSGSSEAKLEFRMAWRVYEKRIEEVKRQGVEATMASVISCIEPQLLQLIIRFDLKATGLSPEKLAVLVKDFVLTPTVDPAKLTKVLEMLKSMVMDVKIGDCYDRLMDLYGQYYRIVKSSGAYVPAKKAAKYILAAVRPLKFRKSLMAEIELVKDNIEGLSPESLFDVIKSRISFWDAYTGSDKGNTSRVQQHTAVSRHKGGGGVKPAVPKGGCWHCGGAHHVLDCSTASDKQKLSMMRVQRKKHQQLRKSRKSGGHLTNMSSGDGKKGANKKSWRQSKMETTKAVGSDSSISGHACIAGIPIDYVLDTGASATTITTAAKHRVERMMKQGQGDPSQCVDWQAVKPYKVVMADGHQAMVSENAVADITLRTAAGSTTLRRVKVQVIPGQAAEMLVGRPELDRLGIISPEEQLRRVQEEVEEDAAAADEVSRVMLAEVVTPTDDDNEVTCEVQSMLQRASDAGAPTALVNKFGRLVNRYKSLWQTKLSGGPPANVKPYDVQVVRPNEPVKVTKLRRYAPVHEAAMKQQVQELIAAGIARKSDSPWASPVLMVKKSNGSWRMCVDLRRVNERTLTLHWPLPRIDDLIRRTNGAKYFAKFDLLKGYWQFPVAERSIKFFAFVTPFGVYEMTRVPMGAKNSGAHFQQVMAEVLGDLFDRGVAVYLDDVLVYAGDTDELLKVLESFFQRLDKFGIRLHPGKAELFAERVTWCGHVISEAGVSVDPKKVEALVNMPTPKRCDELMQFICAASWMRGNVPEMARINAPLQQLMNECLKGSKRSKRKAKGVSLRGLWNPDVHGAVFNAVKNALKDAVTLAQVKPEMEMNLFTDASDTHWGAVLTQCTPQELNKPVLKQVHEPLPQRFIPRC